MTMYPTISTVLKDGTKLPQYAHDGDAGLDICATEDVTLMPQEWKMVGSGISMAIPKGFVGLVVPRSGMGCKGLVLKNTIGVIDAGYRGEIKVPLYNNNPQLVVEEEFPMAKREFPRIYAWLIKRMRSEPKMAVVDYTTPITVHKGDRVAQLLIVPVAQATLLQVDTLDETERQDGGFGSTDRRPRP